ncbi:site-specific integrase [Rhizobium ruizarguesonis]|uniref:tyrosine-type recombinase/integrase n=1 Tax=Rhizobium ruizarguesonis TaxID=2081791 RepID=UPI0010312A04|nr:site-specific integrase [Rhizobium ruizarguesonis]TBA44384.1 site-specific integrase [Rhizobium ruizarguesonis]TBD65469.1 site-specific integrase [Rhizobium ruizarguesonis]
MSKASLKTEKRGPFSVRPRKRDGVITGVWVVDVPPHISTSGKRERKAYENKTAALSAADAMLRELQMTGVIRGEGGHKLSGVTFAQFAERWLIKQADRVALEQKRASSLETNAYHLKALGKMFADSDIARIVSSDIENYQKKRKLEDRCKPPTINSEVATLIQVLSWAQELGVISRVPKYESIPVPPSRPDIPTPEEVEKIVGHLETRTGLLATFLAETGCRKNEAFSLEWSDVDFDAAIIIVQRKAGFTPKSEHSERSIPVSSTLIDRLKEAKADDERVANERDVHAPSYVFPGRFGGKRTDIRKALATAVKKAGVKRGDRPIRLTPHIFRKAMATWLHAWNVSDRMLQARLGHAPGSRVTNRTYVHVSTEEQRAIVFDLSRLSPKGSKPDGAD